MNSVCSHERLELALAGSLNAGHESTLLLHLEECELCAAEMERLSGGEQASREIASMLVPDDLDEAVPLREECSTADFVVNHLEPSEDPSVLGRLGGYDVLDVIGRGGMGVVLKGFDRELKRFVAIKALAPHLAHSALARKRFAREAQAAAAVVNPHVIAIHQVQPSGQLPFLVMPLLTGESLARRLTSRGTLELNEILRIGMQAAEGLAAAHGQGLIHRDVKPANILLEKGVERAVLTDFGLARAADDVSMTRWGVIAGTPEYMSPEQARGEALDGRSDLFSLGCVLYEMATGVSPFRADSTVATLRRIVDERPASMASLAPDLPPWFIGIVERLISKDPAERFASAKETSELLEQCLSHLQQPTMVSLPKCLAAPDGRRSGRPPLFRLLIAAALVLPLILAVVIIVLEFNKGQLTIECAADDVPIRIRQGYTLVQKLTVTKSGATVRMAAGNYVVEVDGVADGIVVQDGTISLQRRGVETVRIVSTTQPGERKTDAGGPKTADVKYHDIEHPISADAAPIIACTGPRNPTRLGALVAHADINRGLAQNVVWLHVWDWSKSDVSRVLLIQKSELGVLAPDGKTMLSAEGETLNLATHVTRQSSGFQVKDDQLVTSVRLSPSGKYAAVMIGSRAQLDPVQKVAPNSGKWTLRLLELDAVTNTGTKIGEFPANANAGVAFSPGEASLIYSSDECSIIRRETANGNTLNEYEPMVRSLNGVVGLTVSPDGSFVAAADYHGSIYVWEQAGKLVTHKQALRDNGEQDESFRARVMRFSHDGTYLALVAGNRVQVMEAETGEIVKKHEHDASPEFANVRWSQDAKTITLVTSLEPTNFVEPRGVATRSTANTFPRVYEWEWRKGSPVLKQFEETAPTREIDRRNARMVVEAYLAMALAGDVAKAGSFAKGNPAEPKQIETMARMLNVKRLPLQSVYVNDPARPTTALATTVSVGLEEKQPDGQREGFLVLTLTMSEEGWFVTDIDFETEEGAAGDLRRFLKSHPKAIGLPPIEDPAGPGQASTTEPADQASHRAGSANNIKQIMLAMHKYSAEHFHLPPAVLYGKDGKGKVPHSWRVALLPYLENGAALYNAYQFDEPWHSAANRKVLAQMPAVYRHPSEDPKSNSSAYFVVEGAANDASLPTAFGNKDGMRFRDILDGASFTIAVVEADLVVPWTKPEDILYDSEYNLPPLGGFQREGFHVGTCDGSVKFLPANIGEKLLRAYFTPAGGEKVPPMEDAAGSAEKRSTANVTRYALKTVKAMDAAHLIGKELPTLKLPSPVDIVAHEDTNSITVRGDDASQMIIFERLKLLDAETTTVNVPDGGTALLGGSAGPLPDKYGIYWSDRHEDHWVTGMKVVEWPTAVNRKLVVEFLLRNEAPKTREIDANVYCGKKSSLALSEGNKVSVDFKETRREKLTAAPNEVLAFKEGRAEISFAGLESGEYTLRFLPVIYILGKDDIGHGVPFDLALPVTFDASYASLPIHWGKPVAGLRLGAMFEDARQGEVKRFGLRDQATIQLFVQNISAKEFECGFDRPYHGGDWGTHITDSSGQRIEGAWDRKLMRIGILIQPPSHWASLAPGEIQPISGELPKFRVGSEEEGSIPNLKHAKFMVVQETPAELRTVPPYDYVLPPGEYSARLSATLRKFASPDVTFAVESARLPFQVAATQGMSKAQREWVIAWDFRYTLLNQRYAMMRISSDGRMEAHFPEWSLLRTQLSPDELSALVALVAKNPNVQSRSITKVAEYSEVVTQRPELFDAIKKVNVRSELIAVVHKGELLELDLDTRESAVVTNQLWKLVGLAAIGGSDKLPKLVEVANRELQRKYPDVSNVIDQHQFRFAIVDHPSGNISVWFNFNVDPGSKDGQVVLRIPQDGQPSIERVDVPREGRLEPERKSPHTALPVIELPKLPETGAERKLPPADGPPVHPKLAADRYAKSGVPLAEQKWPMPPWGAEQGGLSAGIRVIGDARIGGEVTAELWVRNSGAKDVTFSQCHRADVGLSIVAKDKDGKEHFADITQFRAYPTFSHWLLPPGHIVRVKEFTLKLGSRKNDELKRGWVSLDLPPGDYKLRVKWSDSHALVTHAGDWTGELTTDEVDLRIGVADAGADAAKPAAAVTPKLRKLPDEAYTKTGIHCQKFREEDAKRPGGELMGRVMESELGKDPLVLGMRVASDAKWNIGGQARLELVVRNASGSDVKFPQTYRADNGLSVVAIDKDGKEHQAEITPFDGLLVWHHLLLPRAHVVMVKSFTLRFDSKKRDLSEYGVAAFHLPPGDYKLRCKWNDARPDVAHEGEWTGELVSVEHKFKLAAAPAVSEK